MKQFKFFPLSVLFTFSTNYTDTLAAQELNLPHAVITEIHNLEEECRLDKSFIQQNEFNYDYIKYADLNGDGIEDYIIEDAYVHCEAGDAFRHGNGGTAVIIFAGTSDGAIKAFDKTVFGISLETDNSESVAWVAVSGHYCGQKTFASRSAAISCDRPLVWNAPLKQFDFAPLKQARFPSKLQINHRATSSGE